ncbi:MAG: rod shape-determining protein MreC [Patescibacteria group bacterium]|nr:rod shape-determining protein MreC [Patescibacteria group bacterium]
MSYEHKSNVQPKRIGLPIKIVSLIILILVVLYLFFPTLLSSFFTTIVRPFWGIEKNIKEGTAFISPELQNATIIELQKENADLKKIFDTRVSSSSLVAYVLKKPPFSAYDTFIIDAGLDSGVKNGAKVYAIGKVIIGEVIDASPLISKVKLYSSYGEKFEVFIGVDDIQATATGRGGGSFEAVLPRDVKIQEGDTVTIPHLTTTVFGIVKRVIADPARAFSTILFSQPINIYEQKWVEIDI